jgi:hypothetical protein
VDGGSYSLSQKKTNALEMASKYRSLALGSSGVTFLRRADVAE